MKTTIAICLSALFFSFTANTAPAALYSTSSSSSTSSSQLNYADLMYDYQVYAGMPRYRWVIIWKFGDGSTYEQGQFLTEQEALNYVAWQYFGGYEPAGAVDYEIVEVEVEPIMEYVTTYDKKADALALADALENLGLYTQVKSVSVFSYSYRSAP